MWKKLIWLLVIGFIVSATVGCAVGASNGKSSSSASAGSPPADPSGLTLQIVDNSSILLNWLDNASDETGYSVYCSNENVMPPVARTNLGPNATNCVIPGLTAGTLYYFWVLAYNSIGNSQAITGSKTPKGVPAAPVSLIVTPGAISTIDLAWTDVATNETGYVIFMNTSNVKPPVPFAALPADSASYTAINLLQYTMYYFWVAATNEADTGAAASGSGVIGTVPAAPSAFTAVATGTSIALNWTDNADNESAYEVFISNVNSKPAAPDQILSSNAASYNYNSMTPGTRYYFWVDAKNIVGVSGDASANARVENIPDAPGSFASAVLNDTSIRLTWSDSSNETGYNVYWSATTVKPAAPSITLAADSTSYDVTGLIMFQNYNFWIEAANLSGTNGSSMISNRPGTAPAGPSAVTASTNASIYKIDLSWADNANNEQGYFVYYSANGVKPTLPNVILPANTTNWSLTNILAAKTYTFWVSATNVVAKSPDVSASADTFRWIGRNPQIRQAFLIDATLTVNWWQRDTNTNIMVATNASANSLKYTNNGVKPANGNSGGYDPTGYRAYSVSYNSFHQPIFLWADVSTTDGTLTWDYILTNGPDMTGTVTATPTFTSIAFSWPAMAGAYGYRLYYSTSATKPVMFSNAITSNNFTLSPLNPGTTYYFWVEATGPCIATGSGFGISGADITTSATTLGNPITLISTNCVCKTSDTTGWTDAARKNPTNAYDFNINTQWGPNNGSFGVLGGYITNSYMPMWAEVDLGAVKPINWIKIQWEGAYCKAYRFEGCNDESSWTTITNETAGKSGAYINYDVSSEGLSYRYFRLMVDNTNASNFANTSSGMKVLDIQVYQ